MGKELLSRTSENTIQITAEFFEDGYVLRSGRSKIHRYDLDLYVRRDITLDQLLGAVFCGLRDMLQKKYKLDPKENLAGIVYQDLQDPFAFRAADPLRGGRSLRPALEENLRLRVEALRYRHQRRKLADMNARYRMVPDDHSELSPEQREQLGWIVCWQVFHECYQAYANGYPDDGGQADAAQVRSQAYRMHPVIARSAVDMQADDNGVYYGAARHPQLQLTRELDGSKTLAELGFLSSTRLIFDPVLWHHSAALYDTRALDPSIAERLPYYVCGKREEREMDTTPVSIRPIKPPPLKPDMRHTPLVLMVPLVMLLASLLTISLGGGIETASFIFVFNLMLTATLFAGLACWVLYWLSYKWTVRLWLKPYEHQIRLTLRSVIERQHRDVLMMHQDHPPVYDPSGHTDLIHQILAFEGDLYGSEPGDRDFLCTRLGVSEEGTCLVPSEFPVEGVSTEGIYSEICYRNLRRRNPEDFGLCWDRRKDDKRHPHSDTGMITDLPEDLAREYGWLNDAPVLLDLKNAGAVGVVYQDGNRSFTPLIRNMILDLSFHHAPEHLQMVALYPQERDWKVRSDLVRPFKYLPHFGGLLKDRSAFAFGRKEATAIFDQLYNQLQNSLDLAHVVVFVMEEYGLRDHPLAAYLPGNRGQAEMDRGITFVFCKHAERELPAWCARTLLVDPRNNHYLLPRRRSEQDRREYTDRSEWGCYRLKPDTLIDAEKVQDHKPAEDLLYRALRTVSAIRHRKDDHNRLPPMLELFDLLAYPDSMEVCTSQDPKEREAYLKQLRQIIRSAVDDNWAAPLLDTLETPIGCGETGLVTVDLHEAADGPHLLIAGDRDTGKTTAALSLFHTLAVLYSPDVVGLVPVDLCDRGLARRLQYLPHTLRDWILQGGSREEVQAYLQRLRTWLEEEILRRQQLFGHFSVTRLEDYNRAAKESLQHLFFLFDDYELLCRMAPEGMNLSETLAELSRSVEGLGIHFVLISDGSAESLTEQLLEKLQARICLRISDPGLAQRVCRSDEPSRMTMAGRGRAYRLGGLETTAEICQIGCGDLDVAGLAYTPFQVVLAPTGGRNRIFFDSADYTPNSREDIDAWLKAIFEPLRVCYRKKQQRPDGPSPWGSDKRSNHGDEYWYVNQGEDGGDRRWNEAQGESGGDRRWNEAQGESGGDRRWNEAQGESGGDRRWNEAQGESGGDRRWNGTRDTRINDDERQDPDPTPHRENHRRNPREVPPNEKRHREEREHPDPIRQRAYWKERYYHQWSAYPYNEVPPDYQEASPGKESEWIRPDDALQTTIPFGISQTRFLAAVMSDKLREKMEAESSIPTK